MEYSEKETLQFNQKIADYFDLDAPDFEQRYRKNHILQKIRHCFRNETEKLEWQQALEIGCGPGIDLAYFAARYPERQISGIDVAPKMTELAREKIKHLKNARAVTASIEDIPYIFTDRKFDLVYCYFGALNTVRDLKRVARIINQVTAPNAQLILTFINRYYIADIALNLLLLRPGKAWARATQQWAGYSPKKHLASTPRSKKEVAQAFAPFFSSSSHQSYSIIFPAWYRAHFLPAKSRFALILWQIDEILRQTPLRNSGENSLYHFTKRPGKRD